MINLNHRSTQKEMLDYPDIPFTDIVTNMQELNAINTYLGGHAITVKGLKQLISKHDYGKNITICEIGCGGGDNLNALHTWCRQKNISAKFIGIDLKKECIDFALHQYPHLPAKWVTNDYEKTTFLSDKPDIIFSSLFCHHFSEDQLITMLQWMKSNATIGFFINDLHRNRMAYYSIKGFTHIFSKSYLVKNDAPISVARGFLKKEWNHLFQLANIKNYTIKWCWAFRHLIVYKNE